jgi:hypothetical protein
MSEEKKGKIGTILIALVFIAAGIAAVVNPDLMAGYEPSGRHQWLKSLIVWAWGIPGGVAAILFGGLMAWVGIKGTAEEEVEVKTGD